jgi:hypothetical protein
LIGNLGSLLKAQGRLDGARPLYEQALAGSRAALDEAHPSTLSSVNNLGLLLKDQGRWTRRIRCSSRRWRGGARRWARCTQTRWHRS